MRGKPGNAHLGCVLADHLPDDHFAETVPRNAVAPDHWSEHVAIGDTGRCGPGVNRDLNPGRHRHRSDAPVFADEIDDAPTAVALLDMRER